MQVVEVAQQPARVPRARFLMQSVHSGRYFRMLLATVPRDYEWTWDRGLAYDFMSEGDAIAAGESRGLRHDVDFKVFPE